MRKIVAAEDNDDAGQKGTQRADAQGQIAIHVPHNSLLVMHSGMQEVNHSVVFDVT